MIAACDVGYLISSHQRYVLARDRLLASMQTHGIDLARVVVVEGGHTGPGVDRNPQSATRIRATHTSYDYTGPIGWLEHTDAIPARLFWFWLHDTCLVGPETDARIRQADPCRLATAVWGGQCNLMLVATAALQGARDWLLRLKHCTKRQAIDAEGRLWRDLPGAARASYGGDCRAGNPVQPYGLAWRIPEYYTAIDLVKYKANWGQNTRQTEADYVVTL